MQKSDFCTLPHRCQHEAYTVLLMTSAAYCHVTSSVSTPPGKFWNFYWKISRTWKVLIMTLVLQIYLQGPGKSWKLLGIDVDVSFWFQIDVLLQTKIAIIVAIRYVFWDAGMPKNDLAARTQPQTPLDELTALPRPPGCCLWLFKHYWLTTGSWKMLLESWKSLNFL